MKTTFRRLAAAMLAAGMAMAAGACGTDGQAAGDPTGGPATTQAAQADPTPLKDGAESAVAAAEGYLRALGAGDVTTALTYLDGSYAGVVGDATAAAGGRDAYADAKGRVSDVKVSQSGMDGANAKLDVSYTAAGQTRSVKWEAAPYATTGWRLSKALDDDDYKESTPAELLAISRIGFGNLHAGSVLVPGVYSTTLKADWGSADVALSWPGRDGGMLRDDDYAFSNLRIDDGAKLGTLVESRFERALKDALAPTYGGEVVVESGSVSLDQFEDARLAPDGASHLAFKAHGKVKYSYGAYSKDAEAAFGTPGVGGAPYWYVVSALSLFDESAVWSTKNVFVSYEDPASLPAKPDDFSKAVKDWPEMSGGKIANL